jgi:hypothetical protein
VIQNNHFVALEHPGGLTPRRSPRRAGCPTRVHLLQ